MNATQSPSPRQPQSCDRCHELDVHLQEQVRIICQPVMIVTENSLIVSFRYP